MGCHWAGKRLFTAASTPGSGAAGTPRPCRGHKLGPSPGRQPPAGPYPGVYRVGTPAGPGRAGPPATPPHPAGPLRARAPWQRRPHTTETPPAPPREAPPARRSMVPLPENGTAPPAVRRRQLHTLSGPGSAHAQRGSGLAGPAAPRPRPCSARAGAASSSPVPPPPTPLSAGTQSSYFILHRSQLPRVRCAPRGFATGPVPRRVSPQLPGQGAAGWLAGPSGAAAGTAGRAAGSPAGPGPSSCTAGRWGRSSG